MVQFLILRSYNTFYGRHSISVMVTVMVIRHIEVTASHGHPPHRGHYQSWSSTTEGHYQSWSSTTKGSLPVMVIHHKKVTTSHGHPPQKVTASHGHPPHRGHVQSWSSITNRPLLVMVFQRGHYQSWGLRPRLVSLVDAS